MVENNTNAVILLGTLKNTDLSNTEVLCEFFAERAAKEGLSCEIVKLVDRNIAPGTYSDMGSGDEWPKILQKVLAAGVVIFATPVWWGGHSSEIQRVIERLDEIHDKILEGEKSALEGKAGGVIVTGDSDGAQHIIGNVGNFFNAVGLLFPPFATLSVFSEKLKKGAKTSREELLKVYEKDYGKTADKMLMQLLKHAARGD